MVIATEDFTITKVFVAARDIDTELLLKSPGAFSPQALDTGR